MRDIKLCILLLSVFILFVEANIISKSSKVECIAENDVRNINNTICSSKLVVSLTVTADEGKSQDIHANISRIIDMTQKRKKNVELKNPLRIRVIKSPILINYRLYQVGYVRNWVREEIKNTFRGKQFECRDTWYSTDDEVNCGFGWSGGEKIFDSQGFCCTCSFSHRGGVENCSGYRDKISRADIEERLSQRKLRVGHCLVHDHLKYFVMGVYPPEFQFTINITLEQREFLTKNGSGSWRTLSTLQIGPQKRIAVSDTHAVKVQYVADFYPSTFMKSEKLKHRFILIPDLNTEKSLKPFDDITEMEWRLFKVSIRNMSEWMAIDKPLFDMSGYTCNKIGVSYTAFRQQANACGQRFGSCLHNQPYHLWKEEKTNQKEGRAGRFMLHNFGKVYSMPHTRGRTDFQVNFIADRPTTSLLVITMAADDLKVVTRVAPGRIVSAYIDSFEALSTTGVLVTVIQNTGTYTSTYNIYIQHCSAGIDLVPSKILTINPNESQNETFIMHSFHSIGKINYCEANLYDVNSKLLDNLTVTFETLDTCFCYGYCGCACGYNQTTCPDAPQRNNSNLELYRPKWYDRLKDGLQSVGDFFQLHGGKILIMFWVGFALVVLGALKVLHIILTQELKMDAVLLPPKEVARFAKKFADWLLKEWCPAFCDNFWTSCGNCCRFCTRRCCWAVSFGKVKKREKMLHRQRIERGWRAPPYCDGMCQGARYRRSLHRKLMRVMKRTGQKKETAWFSKPYNCSCKVRDTAACLTICKGLFFFFYCPLLPFYWILQFFFIYTRRKWRRWKRIKVYRAEKAEKEALKEEEYLHMDKYRKGLLEKEIITLDQELKKIRQLEREYEATLTKNNELEELQLEMTSGKEDRNISSSASLSDTSDPDQAKDIDELLDPGYPVYFNYPLPKKGHPLKNPGKNYSIKGRLTHRVKKDIIRYHFDLHKYTYQVSYVDNSGKRLSLKPPIDLNVGKFTHTFKDPARALKLVTLVPLYPLMNNSKPKQK